MGTAMTVGNGGLAANSGGKPHESGAKLELQNSVLPEVCNARMKFFSHACSVFQDLDY
jgi:hypothetical protein